MIPVRIDQYFCKHKATAMGISFFGGCCGSLIFPVLLGPVIHNQGIKAYFLASFLIVITFIIPAGLILKKPAWMRRNLPPSPTVEIVETARTDHRSIPQRQYPDIQRFREYKDLTIKVLKSIIPVNEDLERFKHVPLEAWRSLEHNIWPELEKLFDRFQAFVERRTLAIAERRVSIDQRLSSGSQHQPSHETEILGAPENHYADLVMLKLKTMTIKRLKDISTDCVHDNVQHLFRVTTECRKLYRVIIYLNNFGEVTPVVEINTQEENSIPENSTTRSNFEICKNILFHFVCLSRAAHFLTCISVMTTIVDFMMDKGLNELYGEYAIIMLSAGDSFGRIGTGWITDYGWLPVQKFVMFVMLILSLVTFSFPFMPNIATIFTILVLFGILQGSLFIRHPILATKYTRPHEHSTAIGLLNFFSGIVAFGIPAYIGCDALLTSTALQVKGSIFRNEVTEGAFRDKLGSYDLMFYINAAIIALIAIPWIFEPYFLRYLPTEETPATNRDPEPV
ncbi:MFS domain-containing protein [Trichonephila clavipes]|nr:MFS domain-containing protein [Trichonephila clavipes]